MTRSRTSPRRCQEGRRGALLVVVLALGAVVGCGDGLPTSPSPDELAAELPALTESAHYSFRHPADLAADAVRQDHFHEWIVPQLGVAPPRITYLRYRDRAQMAKLTGVAVNGFAQCLNAPPCIRCMPGTHTRRFTC